MTAHTNSSPPLPQQPHNSTTTSSSPETITLSYILSTISESQLCIKRKILQYLLTGSGSDSGGKQQFHFQDNVLLHITTSPNQMISLYRHYKSSLQQNTPLKVSMLSTFDSLSALNPSMTPLEDFELELKSSNVVVLGLDMMKYNHNLLQLIRNAFPRPRFLALDVNITQLREMARLHDPYMNTSQLVTDFWCDARTELLVLYNLTILTSFEKEDLIHVFEMNIPARIGNRQVVAQIEILRLDGLVWKVIPLDAQGSVAQFLNASENGEDLYQAILAQKLTGTASSNGDSHQSNGATSSATSSDESGEIDSSSENAYILSNVPSSSLNYMVWEHVKNLLKEMERLVSRFLGGDEYDMSSYLIMDRTHPQYVSFLRDMYWFAHRYALEDLETGIECMLLLCEALQLCELVPPQVVLRFLEKNFMMTLHSDDEATTNGTSENDSNNKSHTPLQVLQEHFATTSHLIHSSIPYKDTSHSLEKTQRVNMEAQNIYLRWKESMQQSMAEQSDSSSNVIPFKLNAVIQQLKKDARIAGHINLLVIPTEDSEVMDYVLQQLNEHEVYSLPLERVTDVDSNRTVALLTTRKYFDEALTNSRLESTFTRIYLLNSTLLDCVQDFFEVYRPSVDLESLQRRHLYAAGSSKLIHVASRYEYIIDRMKLLERQKSNLSDILMKTRSQLFTRKRKAPPSNHTHFPPAHVQQARKRRRLDSSLHNTSSQHPSHSTRDTPKKPTAAAPNMKSPPPRSVRVKSEPRDGNEKHQQQHQSDHTPNTMAPRGVKTHDTTNLHYPDQYSTETFLRCEKLFGTNPITLMTQSLQNSIKSAGKFQYSDVTGVTDKSCSFSFQHRKVFYVATGTGKSKKEAKQNAVLNMIRLLVHCRQEKVHLSRFEPQNKIRQFASSLKQERA